MKTRSLASFSLRAAPGLLFCALVSLACVGRTAPLLWETYKSRYVLPAGRVVDTGNKDVSHSEGQGYGLLLAQAEDDRETFQQIWTWTKEHLRRPNDSLFAWHWTPAGSKGGRIDDENNASDGDLLIAWALARASVQWGVPEWREAARKIAQDVRKKLIRPSLFGPVLLPGEHGFEKGNGIVVNLSYWIFPALEQLDRVDPAPEWQLLDQSGQQLVEKARFSSWGLPPDWLLIEKNQLKIAPGFQPVYGYDAVRVPLYLAWRGVAPAGFYSSFRRYRQASAPELRATVSLTTAQMGKDAALPGMYAIYSLINQPGDLQPGSLQQPYQTIAPSEPYYSASLGMLSNRAALEAKTYSQTDL